MGLLSFDDDSYSEDVAIRTRSELTESRMLLIQVGIE